MAHGAFGAMGGIQTSATDYAKWVAFLLSAWPPRDGADTGPVRRSSVRELAQGGNYASVRQRPGATGADACRSAGAYGMGMNVAVDCELGLTLSHGGGYPGYGSHVLLLPDYGVGIFALANRTYAGPRSPVWDAAVGVAPGRRSASPAGHGVQRAGAGLRRGRRDVGGRRGDGAARRAGDELPDGPRRRPLGPRSRGPQSRRRRLRDRGADHADRRAVGRLHLDLRAGTGARIAAARPDSRAKIQALGLARIQ